MLRELSPFGCCQYVVIVYLNCNLLNFILMMSVLFAEGDTWHQSKLTQHRDICADIVLLEI